MKSGEGILFRAIGFLVFSGFLLFGNQAFSAAQPLPQTEEDFEPLVSVDIDSQKSKAEEVLLALQTEMVKSLSNVEFLLRQNNTSHALLEAKQILDTVRIKAGIDPKVKIQERIQVNLDFPVSVNSFEELALVTQRAVIVGVAQYRGGLFIDLINLYKRVTLLYIKALKAEMERVGGLTEEDRGKIVSDLVAITVIPMIVVDRQGREITVIEEDVANEDHVYMFNREIKMFLLSEKSLETTEAKFDAHKEAYKKRVANRSAPIKNYLSSLNQCMGDAARLYYRSDSEPLKEKCFDTYFSQFENYQECVAAASKLYYLSDSEPLKEKCFNKFHN